MQQVHDYTVLAQLRVRLKDYRCVFKKSAVGPQAGLVTFSKYHVETSRFTKVNHGSGFVGLFTKGFLYSDLEGVAIYNIHLSANTDGDWTKSSRFYRVHRSELAILLDTLSYRANMPIIVTGDFNIAGDSDIFDDFTESSRLNDMLGNDYRPTFHKEFLPEGEPGRRIDQILSTGDKLNTLRLYEDPIKLGGVSLLYPSDHMGLYAKIRIKS